MSRVDVVEYTDPICSWAWGTEPKLRRLRWRHEPRLNWRRVMGGLVGDAAAGKPDWDRVRAAGRMSDYWAQVSAVTGAPYPKPMHVMTRSTDPAGRAVKAAELQGDEVAQRVLRRFRESIFVFGRAPYAPEEELAEAAAGIEGLDAARWRADLESAEVAAAYQADWEETRAPNACVRGFDPAKGNGGMKHSEGRDRYAFPTLLFRGPGGEHTVPGWAPYEAYEAAMEAASPGSTTDARPDPTPDEALRRWGTLTERELETLCGAGAAGPDWAVAHDWGAGTVWFSPAEALARGLATRSRMQRAAPAELSWRPVREGVTLAPLRMRQGAGSFLMQYAPGSRSPAHIHPGGEEIYVVSGTGRIDDVAFGPGDFIYTPPGESHTLFAESAVTIHVILPEPVVVTEGRRTGEP